MKHFVTLFPPAKNVHLVKDVGQIPYQMQKHFNYRSTLVCYKSEDDYPYLKKEVEGLNIEFVEDRGTTLYWEKAVVSYLFKKARSIDVLNLYHLSQASMLYGLLFKWLNPKGILYLKLDFNLSRFKREGFRFSKNGMKEAFHRFIFNFFLRKTDIISVETREVENILRKSDKRFNDKLLYLPNGVDHVHLDDVQKGNTGKENMILTVGRIGLPEKNHGLFLEALSETDLKDWKVVFAGPVNKNFKPKVERFFEQHPELRDRIQFTGEITDRTNLYSLYKRAKIFCLPSKSEGFPMVLIEALSFGNYLIGTDKITSIKEVTQQGTFGHIIPAENTAALSRAIQEVTSPDFYTSKMGQKICEYAKKYRWESIIKDLNKRLDEIEESR